MTTKSSPIQVLKAQAQTMARTIKASGKQSVKAALVMDDKTILVQIVDIPNTTEKEIAAFVLDLMQEY